MIDRPKTRLHFVGIGGIGMSGLAEVFQNQGYQVRGSDLQESENTRKLSAIGVDIRIGHSPENVRGAHVVITSSAVKEENPEVIEAKRLHIPVIPRAEMLGELMRGKIGIAVAGTHGKTTTTSMMASILTASGKDPTLVIGGKVDSFGGNAKLGKGEYVVAEADESDGSFLHLPATVAIITNIDEDHLDHFKSIEAIDEAFFRFVAKLPFYGVAAACADDPGVRRNLERWTKPYVTYGLSEGWDYSAKDIGLEPLGSNFTVMQRGEDGNLLELGRIRLNVPGKHNVLNALGTIAVSLKLGISFQQIQKGIEAFRGVQRRFEILHWDKERGTALIDDYGHHPAEVKATLVAVKNFWSGRIVCVFQPHRFSRTLHAREGFLNAFQYADRLYVSDVYAAGEKPIPGATSQDLVNEMKGRESCPEVHYLADLDAIRDKLAKEIESGDLILCMGAGSITRMAHRLAEELETRARSSGQ